MNVTKEMVKEVKAYLQIKNEYVTRQQICIALGIKYDKSNDRKIRHIIAQIAAETPVLSPSNGKGYKLLEEPKNEADVLDLIRQQRENSKRAREIEKRNVPIDEAIRKLCILKGNR